MKHQPIKKKNGFWSCRTCKWEFITRPGKSDCPGYLRIERANEEYKTERQWFLAGFELIVPPGHVFCPVDACSIVHLTVRYLYFHKSHVRPINDYVSL